MRHLHPDDVYRIAALADACRRPAEHDELEDAATGAVLVPLSDLSSRPRPACTALATAVRDLSADARAELVALMWLGGDTNGDGRDPIGWPGLVARARAVSAGADADAAYVAGKHRDLGVRLRMGLEAREVVHFN